MHGIANLRRSRQSGHAGVRCECVPGDLDQEGAERQALRRLMTLNDKVDESGSCTTPDQHRARAHGGINCRRVITMIPLTGCSLRKRSGRD